MQVHLSPRGAGSQKWDKGGLLGPRSLKMQLSRQADYAVRILLDVASAGDGVPVSARQIARRQLVPYPFLRKIASSLASAGFVDTRRGRGGGITLAQPAEGITLRQIVEAMEGPILLNRCLIAPGTCSLDRVCPVHLVWRRVQEDLLGLLGSVTLADLAREGRRLRRRRSP